jgi:hypothetical protein
VGSFPEQVYEDLCIVNPELTFLEPGVVMGDRRTQEKKKLQHVSLALKVGESRS